MSAPPTIGAARAALASLRALTEGAPPAHAPGLTVVLDPGGPADASALDEALFALGQQDAPGVELAVVAPEEAGERARVARALEGLRPLLPLPARLVPRTALDAQVRTARVAFLRPGVLVYPHHYAALLALLDASPGAAWVVARGSVVRERHVEGEPPFARGKQPFPLGEADVLRWEQLLSSPALLFALVLDRTLLPGVALPVPDPADPEALGLPLRLAALAPPRFAGGIASCELWGAEAWALDATPVPQGLHALVPVQTLAAELAQARADGEAARALRHRLADRLFHAARAPVAALRALAGRSGGR